MAHILARRHLPALARFASSNVLIGFDYDGTLAPLVAIPARARMRAVTRRLLVAVARRYPCVVLSGRGRADAVRLLGNVPVRIVCGNHGLEPFGQTARHAIQTRGWVRRLRARLASWDGVVIEDKKYSVTIHYRQARRRRLAIAAIGDAVRRLRGARVMGGIEVVNLVPRNAPHKGTALDRARRLLACDAAIYLGDDETDEDVFAHARPDRLLGIRIGRAPGSQAAYHLRNQAEIDWFLELLLTLRPAAVGGAVSDESVCGTRRWRSDATFRSLV